MTRDLLLGLVSGLLLGWIGHRVRLLSRSGALGLAAATLLTFVGGGWTWGIPLLCFFLSWGIWRRYRAPYKTVLQEQFDSRTPIDAGNVGARLGWAMLTVLLHVITGEEIRIFFAFLGALATATADVWARELGMLSARPPRLINTGDRVRRGASGAISLLGLVASLAASSLLGFAGLFPQMAQAWLTQRPWIGMYDWLPLAATLGGTVGCLTDSLLGATAQAIYYCERCEKRTEKRVHSCGEETRQIRGWPWLDDAGVDLVSTIVGGTVTAGIAVWLAQIFMRW
ncbi:MAG: DUF92 domain-containing protein [Anaerolineales bacterium]